MEETRLLAARRLLAVLRAEGCIVMVESERLLVDGVLTSARQVAILEHKVELIALLTAAQAAAGEPRPAAPAVQAETTPGVPASWAALVASKPPPRPSLPRGPVRAGVAIATPEMQRWRALRDQAICQGRRFDLPPPRYRYPEFE